MIQMKHILSLKRINIIVILIVLLVSCNRYEKRMIKKGDEIVGLVEQFKMEHGRLPNNMVELKIDTALYEKICYLKHDSINFKIWFGTSLGESITYYSDTKRWEEVERGIGNKK